MSSELTVMTFRHRGEAETVLQAMRAMRRSSILGLDHVVVATKDREGEISLRPRQEPAAARQNRETGFELSLAQVVFGAPAEGIVDALTESGMDGRFLCEIARMMEHESSALLFLTRESAVCDPTELRSTLALFRGTIHQTSLPAEVEACLSKGQT